MNHAFWIRSSRLSVALALSLNLLGMSVVQAAPGELNSVNKGPIINGGNYFNTRGGKTVFKNNKPAGLWLKSGNTVRGLEKNASGQLTGNGGVLHLQARNGVVRIDGTLDVSGVHNGKVYLGNGGKLFVDAAYLYQNGSVFANGFNGGSVHFNVGSATFTGNSKTTALGFGGKSGQIRVNSSGLVDIQQGAVLKTAGKVVGTLDTNVIQIKGSIVNNEGIIQADGIALADSRPEGADNDIQAEFSANLDVLTPPVPESDAGDRGGKVLLVASGNTPLEKINCVIENVDNTLVQDVDEVPFTAVEEQALTLRNSDLVFAYEGSINNTGTVSANGAAGHQGGSVIAVAANNILNSGTIQANGGESPALGQAGANGGTVVLMAKNAIINADTGVIQSNGGVGFSDLLENGSSGGQGGVLAFSYNTLTNDGLLQANGGRGGHTFSESGGLAGQGGQGGLVVFGATSNPTGLGTVQANGGQNGFALSETPDSVGGEAGTIVAPLPEALASDQIVEAKAGAEGLNASPAKGDNRPVAQTQANEAILHQGNLILLSQQLGETLLSNSFSVRLNGATVRTTALQGGGANAEIVPGSFESLVIGNSDAETLVLDNAFSDDVDTDPFTRLNSMSVLTSGDLINEAAWHLGLHENYDLETYNIFSDGGGIANWIAGGSLINEGSVDTFGTETGGSILVASGGTLTNNGFFATNTATNTIDENAEQFSQGGNIVVNAGGDLLNYGGILGAVDNSFYEGVNTQIGATVHLYSPQNIVNTGWIGAEADVNVTGDNQAHAEGGWIESVAGLNNLNTGVVTATADARGDSWGEHEYAPATGGYIWMDAGNTVVNGAVDDPDAIIEANGATEGGEILLTAGTNPLGELPVETVEAHSFNNGVTPDEGGTLSFGEKAPQIESVYNFATIQAIDLNELGADGQIALVANGQVVLAENSVLFSYTVPTGVGLGGLMNNAQAGNGTLILAAGGNVKEAFCCGETLSLPVAPVGKPNGRGIGLNNRFNLAGLFQDPDPDHPGLKGNSNNAGLISFGQASMFLAQEYLEVTENILAQAFALYQERLAQGQQAGLTQEQAEAQAVEAATQFLKDAGVDATVAEQLIAKIQAGELQADPKVVVFLQQLLATQAAVAIKEGGAG